MSLEIVIRAYEQGLRSLSRRAAPVQFDQARQSGDGTLASSHFPTAAPSLHLAPILPSLPMWLQPWDEKGGDVSPVCGVAPVRSSW